MAVFPTMSDRGAGPRLSDAEYAAQVEQMAQMVEEAELLVVGAGSGLSSAAGHNHYHATPAFLEAFAPFVEYYRFKSMMDGYYHLYSSYEQQWAYYAAYAGYMIAAEVGAPYRDLMRILKGRDAFMVTTNVDTQFERAVEEAFGAEQVEENLCLYQGSFAYLQCSQPCHDALYPSEAFVREALRALDLENWDAEKGEAPAIPADLVPRCPECGRVMVPWVRDNDFLQGEKWRRGVKAYESFLRRCEGKRVLFMELGVGDMTPGIIKMPFWDMTHRWEKARLITIDHAKDTAPAHLVHKCLASNLDLAQAMRLLADRLEG